MDVLLYILLYLGIINLVGFLLMGIDKAKAKRHAYRIPEATLFSVAVFGGSIGSIIGMYTFRHKTKHKSFVIGMPAILVAQIIIVVAIYLSPLEIVFFG
ncbi:MAG: DUF1294 domain-containing protein [Lachnospiraceae bacterium]|nr:DUF1294 domain-containing protein [Lachnospiraceae bacterium]